MWFFGADPQLVLSFFVSFLERPEIILMMMPKTDFGDDIKKIPVSFFA